MADKPKDPNVKKQPAKDQAKQAGKVNLEDKANPTKPQQVQGKNVNRP